MPSETELSPILVTGAAGFIGSRFVASCNERSIPVISVDGESLFRERNELAGIDFGTVIDTDALPNRLADLEFGSVMHLGACTDTTELDVDFLTRVNLDASKRLWNACTDRSIPLVYASSAATYGDGTKGFVDDESEHHLLEPLNPYGDSKLQFDLWAVEEERSGRRPKAWSGFKFFNVYGYGERHKGPMSSVVVQAFDQIRATGKLKLFRSHRDDVADGHQTRDFVFVDDVVEVLWFALRNPLKRGIYNLGSGHARTFLDLGRAVFQALGEECVIDWIPTPEHLRERYQYFTEADLTKLREAGYDREFTSLEDGVKTTVERLQARL
ncbi:MAG: ADP-glyceromanno-heptose 6-epimerase [Planctomycetota bacterium]